jgi:hypothetical protein
MNKTNKKENWVTEDEAAAILQLPANFIRKLVLTGPLKGVISYLGPKKETYCYNKTDIENYIFEDCFFTAI